MKPTTLALLLALCACQKTPAPQVDNPVERARKSPDVAKFYELTRSEASLLRMKVLDSAKLRDILSQQNEVMSRVRVEFKGVHFTQAMTEAIFNSPKSRKLASRTPYTIDTNCKLQWDEMNNGCWNSFLWGQWWGFLGGFLTWGTTINNAATFRSCTVAAEAEYYYCTGD